VGAIALETNSPRYTTRRVVVEPGPLTQTGGVLGWGPNRFA
jgi:hypothetical protein